VVTQERAAMESRETVYGPPLSTPPLFYWLLPIKEEGGAVKPFPWMETD